MGVERKKVEEVIGEVIIIHFFGISYRIAIFVSDEKGSISYNKSMVQYGRAHRTALLRCADIFCA